ncbi:DNA methyltransferase [Marinobacter shengliensis]|uniref:DNA methyltransferase n=1 Tax=Marinobacter shengliensis TaxID=1389223 RepID=UPI001E3AAFF4|nr:DNA methyltransferase [Marinobacter shengliensis]MCD1632052.1 site-specific DNA-methyltransferase [Marinobacter shengliensis]
MNTNKISRQLNYIDWDFTVTRKGIARPNHWYPGSFTSQLPSALIQTLTQAGDVIFDPYGGIGTTSAESIRLGRRVWSVDLNPVGILGSYVFSSLLILKIISHKDLELFFNSFEDFFFGKSGKGLFSAKDEVDQIGKKIDEILGPHLSPTPDIIYTLLRKSELPNSEYLSSWIHPLTLSEIERFKSDTDKFTSFFLKLFVDFMQSANLRGLSSQIKSWGHIADNVKPKSFSYKDSNLSYRRWLKGLRNSILKIDSKNFDHERLKPWAAFSLHDWSTDTIVRCPFQGGASSIVTSPPYGDAIDYIYAQKLSLYYLGYTDEELSLLSAQEIGARRKRFKSDSREIWARQLADSILIQSEFVSGKFLATVLPHKNHGREAGLGQMKSTLESNGWNVFYEADRSISQKKARQSWTSIKMETITIFERKS